MKKDWTGNKTTAFTTNGASNHSEKDRAELDYYATNPEAMQVLLEAEKFSNYILEPAVGEGHLVGPLIEHGKIVRTQDITDRGFPGTIVQNFFDLTTIPPQYDIITNPPYKYAQEFITHALSLIVPGQKIAIFLKLTFLEGQKRQLLFTVAPPRTVYVFSKRVNCARNGNFDKNENAVAYAWFVWEKGYTGQPQIKWI